MVFSSWLKAVVRMSAKRRGRGQIDGHAGLHPSRPCRQHHDLVGHEDGLADGVGDQDGRRSGLPPDVQELDVHPLAGDLIQGTERLVEQEDAGVQDERPGDGDALLHAARELGRTRVLETLEADEPDQVQRLARLGAIAGDLERQPDILDDGPPGQERRALEDEAHLMRQARLGRCRAFDLHLAGGRLQHVGHQPQKRALAAAGRADQRVEAARREIERDIVEGTYLLALQLEVHRHAIERDATHPPPPACHSGLA